MEELYFRKPDLSMKALTMEYKNEHFNNGEKELHGSALLDSLEYEDWFELTEENSKEETVHENWVVSDTYFVVRKPDSRIIGMVDIRHYLNGFLAQVGGHIGYGVRPSERKKGYGTEILRMALDHAKGLGLHRVMLGCFKDNKPSSKTILSCGGKKEREFSYQDGKIVEIYWIDIS